MIPRAVAVVALLLTMLTASSGIKCYECVHNSQRMKRQQRYVYPCSDFDGSEKFIRDCPDSALCIYQHITLPLTVGLVSVHTMDGCTPNATQLPRYSEVGLVKEGCIQHISRYKPPSSVYCYCGDDLCNGGPRAAGGAQAVTLSSLGAVIVAAVALIPSILTFVRRL